MLVVTSMAAASCAAALLTASRVFGFKRIVKNPTKTDVIFTIGSVAVLGGTLTGALTAVLAGLMMALLLSFFNAIYRAVDWVSVRIKRQDSPQELDWDNLPSSGDWGRLC